MILSSIYQTFNNSEEENDLSLGQQINTIFNDYSENSINNFIPSKKPRLSLKDSRTKLKQLRDKLSPSLSEEKKSENKKIFYRYL